MTHAHHPAHHGSSRWKTLGMEFAHHLPYTLVGSFIAMAAVWWFGTQSLKLNGGPEVLYQNSLVMFHLFHPLHLCLSAIATTSLFWRYERRVPRTLIVGSLGTAIPCGLSDYIFPFLGGRLLGQPMELHICLLAHPLMFWAFLGMGILAGFLAEERLAQSHLFSHGAHVFVSSAASLLYLISFGFTAWMTDVRYLLPAFIVIVVAVWLPCCISDIVVPVSAARHHLGHHGLHHAHHPASAPAPRTQQT